MAQFIKICGLVTAGALFIAATPVWAGGHFAGRGFVGHVGGPRVVAPGRAFAAPLAAAPNVRLRPGAVPFHRPGMVAIARPPFRSSFFPGFHHRRFVNNPGFFGSFGRFGFDFGYAYPRGRFFTGYYGAAGLPLTADAYYSAPVYPSYPAYPVGYDDASYAPTGNGVVYNVPPPGCCVAKIITLSGNHVQRETYVHSKQRIIVRGSASVD
jgi:hypothetical protein